MRLRSLLFVPGDRPERIAKAQSLGADALILDLEDSVSPANKAAAREAVAEALSTPRVVPLFVRINPIDSAFVQDDLAAIATHAPDAIVLPKADGAASIRAFDVTIPILPIATETAAAVFQLGSYADVRDRLIGLTWGAEDLPAAIGATSSREDDGSLTPPYQMVRALTLFAAHAANVAAIETVYPNFRDTESLATYARRARRDGFTGMMAIHPAQVPIINAAFAATEAEIEDAHAIVALFAENPGAGALQRDGKMLDAPHLKSAERLLANL